jgi:PP-loop superfamily ATP-utilizing enzyme
MDKYRLVFTYTGRYRKHHLPAKFRKLRPRKKTLILAASEICYFCKKKMHDVLIRGTRFGCIIVFLF